MHINLRIIFKKNHAAFMVIITYFSPVQMYALQTSLLVPLIIPFYMHPHQPLRQLFLPQKNPCLLLLSTLPCSSGFQQRHLLVLLT